QELRGNLVIVRSTDATGTTLDLTVGNASLTLGGGAVSLTNGAGHLVVSSGATGSTLSGSLSGTVALNIPNVTLSGAVRLELDTAAQKVAFTGSGISLHVFGQTLSGDLAIVSTPAALKVDVTNAELSFGGGLVRITEGEAHLTVTTGVGIAGTVTGAVVLNVPGVTIDTQISAVFNPAGDPKLRIGVTDATIGVAGVSLHVDSLWFSQRADGSTRLALTGASLTLGDGPTPFVSVTGGTADLAVTAAGLKGTISATATIKVPGLLDTSGSVKVTVDTATGHLAVEVTNLSITVGTLGTITGDFGFTQSTTAGITETVIALSNVSADIGNDGSAELTQGSGLLVLRGGSASGVAGFISGKANIGAGAVAASGTVLLRINTILNAEIDTTVVLNGRTLAVKFAASASSVFSLTISEATLNIGDFVTIEGSVSFEGDRFAGTGLMVFLGRGPVKIEGGGINPLAVGVLLSDARIALIRTTGATTTYALVATGTVSIIGVPGVTIAGATSVRVNTTGGPVNETLSIPGSSDPGIPVVFTGPEMAFTVTAATLGFAGYALTGTFAFGMVGTDVKITISGAALNLGGALSITDIDGSLLATSAGLVADLDAKLAVPALLATPTDVALAIDTRAGAATPLRLEVSNVAVEVAGQSLQVGSMVVQQVLSGGVTSTYLALTGVGLSLAGGAVRLTDGNGFLVLAGSGFAGRVGGTVHVSIPGVTLQGALGVAINSTAAPVNASLTVAGQPVSLVLPAGPYLRVEGSGVVLDIMGQRITADIAFEQATTVPAAGGPGETVLRIALTNVSLSFGGTSPVATLTGGTALFLSRTSGLAGRVSGSIALTVPGVVLSGTLAVLVNTGTTAVDESFRVGDGDVVRLVVPAGGTTLTPATYLA
ncbi:MAG: hypothetical protein KIT69_14735, partial [Propionibacteriaceae bacterium]|nr:hypothetical protein [Propionibacteriaceae bacterium]